MRPSARARAVGARRGSGGGARGAEGPGGSCPGVGLDQLGPASHPTPSALRYMKYLYPYECETRALSSPGELQAAIDSNRREGRRQAYTNAPLFGLAGQSPWGTLGPASGSGPAPPAPTPGPRTARGSASGLPAHACAQLSPSPIKKGVRGERLNFEGLGDLGGG